MQKFKIIAKPLLGEKYVEGKKEKERKSKNNAKFNGHYVHPRMHNVCGQALHSHQYNNACLATNTFLLVTLCKLI